MKYAAIAKCPVFNGRPIKIDSTKARQVPGVRDIVEIKGLDNPTFLMPGVAVVADSTWAAFKGRDALVIQWDEGPYASESNATLDRAVPEAAGRAAGDAAQLRPRGRCAGDGGDRGRQHLLVPVRVARDARAAQLHRRLSRWRGVGSRPDPDADGRAVDRVARDGHRGRQGARALHPHRRRVRAAADVGLRGGSRGRRQGDWRSR